MVNVAVALSMAVAAGAVVAWAKSYSTYERLVRNDASSDGFAFREFSIESSRGVLRVEDYRFAQSPDARVPFFVRNSRHATPTWRRYQSEAVRLPEWQAPWHPHASGYEPIGGRPATWPAAVPRVVSHRFRDNSIHAWRGIWLPYWSVVAASLLLPVWKANAIRRHRTRRRRTAVGLCGSCGYDLRASPAACPECGAVARVK